MGLWKGRDTEDSRDLALQLSGQYLKIYQTLCIVQGQICNKHIREYWIMAIKPTKRRETGQSMLGKAGHNNEGWKGALGEITIEEMKIVSKP